MADPSALGDVAALLACPHCGGPLTGEERSLVCGRGHRFDVARQGYVNLAPTGTPQGSADTAAMVAARDRFLGGGHYTAITEALARTAHAVVPQPQAFVLDLGAGPGHHLAAVVDDRPGWLGLALDLSKHALRRAARAHPRVRAVAADVWQQLPLQARSADLVVCVFAPRNPAEVQRVLRADGVFVLVTPAPGHLTSLVEHLDLMLVEPGKRARVEQQTRGRLALDRLERLSHPLVLGHDDVEALVLMGPNAWHTTPDELRDRLRRLPEPVHTACEVEIAVYRPVAR